LGAPSFLSGVQSDPRDFFPSPGFGFFFGFGGGFFFAPCLSISIAPTPPPPPPPPPRIPLLMRETSASYRKASISFCFARLRILLFLIDPPRANTGLTMTDFPLFSTLFFRDLPAPSSREVREQLRLHIDEVRPFARAHRNPSLHPQVPIA